MDNKYLNTLDKAKCCGCRACEQACSFNAITMSRDEEGFLYPVLDASKCTGCGMCHRVCPISSTQERERIKSVFALQYKDTSSLLKSSSGGVFIGIAKEIIKSGGIVFGCILNENNEAIITHTDSPDFLEKMQGSKYVSSDTRDSYLTAKKYLEEGKTVFFTGAPCQVAGLKSFLKKKYDNLITMDFLCHGMPSHTIFNENIKYLENKHKGTLTGYEFRDKGFKGWGLVTSYRINGKKYYEPGKTNAYFTGFINGYLNRYSCYECSFRGENRISDMTVGDFWGYDQNKIDKDKGVSFISLNSTTGERIFDEIIDKSFIVHPADINKVSAENGTILSEKKESIPEIRKNIYKELYETSFEEIRKKHLIPKNYLKLKLINKIPRKIKKSIMKLLHI